MNDPSAEKGAVQPAANTEQTATQKMSVFSIGMADARTIATMGHSGGAAMAKEGRQMITETISQWGGTIVESLEDIFTGYFHDPTEALKAAITIERRSGQKNDKKSWLPVRILIHHGNASLQDGSLRGEAATFLTKLAATVKFGHVYVSKEVWTSIRDLKLVEFQPVADANRDAKLFDVVWHPETDCRPKGADGAPAAPESDVDISQQFVHGASLVQGENPRCFYCGSKKHLTPACPSKLVPNSAHGLERLGYLSLDEMNDLFSEYLRKAGDDLPVIAPSSGVEQEYFLAPLSFYDLRKPFQLRFLYAVWNARPKDEWHKIRESKKESSNEGGMLWLALDCIRTSQLEQAEDLLIRHSQRTVKDYRIQCGLAIVRIEKGNYSEAINFLNEALGFELSAVQRVHVLLLLYRVHEIIGDQGRAYEKLRDALRVESFCPEAIFLDVARQFNEKRTAEAATRLLKLVQIFREYYPAALISPDLADFQDTIVPELSKVKEKIRAEAKEAAGEADREIDTLRNFLDEDDEDFSQIIDMYKQMQESWARPKAFFNCWDTAYLGKKIGDLCRVLNHERASQAEKAIDKIEARYNAAVQNRFARTMGKLRAVATKISELRAGLENRQSFKDCMEACEEMSKTLDNVDTMIEELQQKKEFYAAISRFVRQTVTILLISAVVALVLFPGSVFCVESFWPGMTPFQTTDIWQIQKAILCTGVVVAFLVAGMSAASRAHSGKKAQPQPARIYRAPTVKAAQAQPARNTRGTPGKRR